MFIWYGSTGLIRGQLKLVYTHLSLDNPGNMGKGISVGGLGMSILLTSMIEG